MTRLLLAAATVFTLGATGAGLAFERSPLPQPRPSTQAANTQIAPSPQATSSPQTAFRSEAPATTAQPDQGTDLTRSPIPTKRPAAKARRAQKAMAKRQALYEQGAVCGVAAIRGAPVAPVPGKISGCGIEAPVRITAIGDVTLSRAATVDCTTAKALHTWVEQGAKPALAKHGGGLASLRVAASYACRTRNNQKGAKISEHGKGRAIDISAMGLRDGTQITVLNHWGAPKYAKAFRQMHKAACGPFGTVLGPNADRYHKDHFHFDTARYRSGSYCR